MEPLEENLVAMTPQQMALIVDAAEKHVAHPNNRSIAYQIGMNDELMARLWEACGRKKTDLFVNTVFEIGLLHWREAMIKQVFLDDEKLVAKMVKEACEDIREGETTH